MDTQLFFIINGAHTGFLDGLFYLVSQKSVWVPLYVALLYAVWRNYSWRGVLAVLLMVGVGMLFTDWANAHFLRPWIGRLRPSNPDNPIAPMVHIVRERRGHGCGFPSCHSANIWLLVLVVMHWLRSRLLACGMVLTGIAVCYSRVYLGFHYPGDILGGFVLACIVAALMAFLHRRYLHFSPVAPPRHAVVPAVVAALTLLSFAIIAALETL